MYSSLISQSRVFPLSSRKCKGANITAGNRGFHLFSRAIYIRTTGLFLFCFLCSLFLSPFMLSSLRGLLLNHRILRSGERHYLILKRESRQNSVSSTMLCTIPALSTAIQCSLNRVVYIVTLSFASYYVALIIRLYNKNLFFVIILRVCDGNAGKLLGSHVKLLESTNSTKHSSLEIYVLHRFSPLPSFSLSLSHSFSVSLSFFFSI